MPTYLSSLLLASSDPDRLKAWYGEVFDLVPNADGFLVFGEVAVLIDGRADVAEHTVEPARVILNFEVPDIQAATARLRAGGGEFLLEPEWRGQAWFATALDPDGNYLQVIQLSSEYFTSRGLPDRSAQPEPAEAQA